MHFLCLKYSIGLLFLIVSFSCNVKRNFHSNNKVIEQLYKKDNEVRLLDAQTDTVNLERYDKVHREKIFQLLANGEVKTPIDKIRAAWILQHTAAKICDGELTSISPENFLLAYQLSSSAWDAYVAGILGPNTCHQGSRGCCDTQKKKKKKKNYPFHFVFAGFAYIFYVA